MTLSLILPEILKIQILIMNQMVNLHLVLTWFIPSPCMRYTLNVILIWKFSPVVIKMNFRSYAIENQIDFMIRTKDFFCILNKKIPKDKHFLIFRDLFKSHLFYCSLAQKQKAEIMTMVDKAVNYTTYKKMLREDLGDSVKYIQVTNTDKDGKNKKPVIEIN